jgi:hypothetical protein
MTSLEKIMGYNLSNYLNTNDPLSNGTLRAKRSSQLWRYDSEKHNESAIDMP